MKDDHRKSIAMPLDTVGYFHRQIVGEEGSSDG